MKIDSGTADASFGGRAFVEFPIPTADSNPIDITVGPDGNLWFAEAGYAVNQIGRITTGGAITEFAVPGGHRPIVITSGPDGNLWFGTQDGYIESLTPAGVFTAFQIPTTTTTTTALPHGITTGPDGNLWFTNNSGPGTIGRITPTGTITQFAMPAGSSSLGGITTGSDGCLWAAGGAMQVTRVTTLGAITGFGAVLSQADGVALGPDGNVWVAINGNYTVGKVTPAGVLSTLSVTTNAPRRLTVASDGNIWFTMSVRTDTGGLGRITPAGTLTEFPYPTTSAGPLGITSGPDGNLWITEYGGNAIARLSL
jgi:streptogramin lyase